MISVIIPAYNNLELFQFAIASVLSQTYSDIELLIVDDSANEDIAKFVRSLNDSRIRYYHNIPSLGAVKNWNYGFSLAKGNYITLMHHDESFENETFLQNIMDEFNKGYDVIVSNIKVNSNGNIKEGLIRSKIKKVFLSFPVLLLTRNVIGPCACFMFRRECLQLFDEKLQWIVDSEWYYRLLRKRNVCFLDNNFIVSSHGHKDQISQNIDRKKISKRDIEILKASKPKLSVKLALYLRTVLNVRLFKIVTLAISKCR